MKIAGMILISLAFIGSLSSALYYYYFIRTNKEELLKRANQFHKSVLGILLIIGIMLYYSILVHDFSLHYVANYSSKADMWYYQFSAFWAGQEGTFYLWILYTAIFGVVLIRRNDRFLPYVMIILHITIFSILLILLKQSPFRPLDPAVLVNLVDGKGLNPLLKNYWMIIHPPTLFLGYSSVIVPAAYGFAALWKKEYSEWIKHAFPWTLFSAAILGLGVMMGGHWAYIILGWGGYWAWDPVENASIFPWFIIVACFHGMLIARRNKAFIKTTIALAISSYLLMIYGSFLTRSGVLGEFSVHSFSSLGINGYLVSFISIYLIMTAYLFISRRKELPHVPIEDKMNKEMILGFVVIVLVLSTFAILIGTSIPLFTLLAEKQRAAAQPEVYNYVFSYVISFILFFMGLGPILKWKTNEITLNKINLYSIISLSVLVGVSIYLSYPNLPIQYYLVYITAFWALFININRLVIHRKSGILRASSLAHSGLAMMAIGVMASSTLGSHNRVLLSKGEATAINGVQINYTEVIFDELDKNRIIYKMIAKDLATDHEFEPELVFTYSDFNKSTMSNPYIDMNLFRDIYFSPVNAYEIPKGTAKTLAIGDSLILSSGFLVFEGFNVLEMNPNDNIFRIQSNFGYSSQTEKGTITSEFERARGTERSILKKNESLDLAFKITGVNAASKSVDIIYGSFNEPILVEQLEIELSKKPYIIVLWIGVITLVIGVLLAVYEHNNSLKKQGN